MAEAMDRNRKGDVSKTVCAGCAEKLVAAGFKVCVADTTWRETQTELKEVDTQ